MTEPSSPAAWIEFLRHRTNWDERRRLVFAIYLATAIANIVSMAIMLWYGFLQPSWLEFTNLPRPILRDVIPGGPILMVVGRCNSSGAGRIYLADSRLIRVDRPQPDIEIGPAAIHVPAGCTTMTTDRISAPMSTPYGVYEMHGSDEVAGTWQTMHVQWQTARFNVIAPLGPAQR